MNTSVTTPATDLHTALASKMFHVSARQVTPLQRYEAKKWNYGLLYGMNKIQPEDKTVVFKRAIQEALDKQAEEDRKKQYVRDNMAKVAGEIFKNFKWEEQCVSKFF